jgi:hypothetical protein
MTDEERDRIIQRIAKQIADDMMAALCGSGAFTKPQPTALRLTPRGTIEVVELRDEPPKQCPRCGPFLLCAEHASLVT